MGASFPIEDYIKYKKVRLNLSTKAYEIIKQDIKNFYLNETKETTSGFLNQIVSNFYEQALASINLRVTNKETELNELINSPELTKVDSKSKELIINTLVNEYKDKLIKQVESYSKGVSVHMDINLANIKLLREDIFEADYYGSESKYIKALLEEYAERPSFIREQIFFKNDIVDKIEYAITNKCQVKITIKQKYKVKNKTYYTRTFFVSPYKLMTDKANLFNYLVGFSQEVNQDQTLKDKQISSFRISQIAHLDVYNSKKASISKEEKKAIENLITLNTVQYLSSPNIDIKVRFNQKGLEKYQRIIYLRPNNYTKDSNDHLIYTFHCTEKHFLDYFIKFLKDIEVLEPLYLREKVIKWYKGAISVYE